jgi:hypothetical protein
MPGKGLPALVYRSQTTLDGMSIYSENLLLHAMPISVTKINNIFLTRQNRKPINFGGTK